MNFLTAENICKSYGEKNLFKNINLSISNGDKVGLIGVNGTGKSTLLKILCSVETADSGNITTMSNLKIEYLPQNPEFDNDATILQQVFCGNSPIMSLLKEYELVVEGLNSFPNDSNLQKKLLALNLRMDALDAWNVESDAKNILTRLGIFNFSSKVGTLSGGEKKRVALASALISPADLLILDEPTNHIDSTTVEWLEDYLNKRNGALLMITHDRYFLNRVSNRIIELSKGNLYSYTGNYSIFLEKKAEREELNLASENKRQSLLKKELAWIRKGAKARTTKQKARIDRFEKLSSEEVDISNEKVELSSVSTRLGKKVVELSSISMQFGEKKVIDDFNYIFSKNEKVGVVGLNGSGKSTLINIIAGNISPDSGVVEKGETVKIGYYHQENIDMNENLRVIDYVKEAGEIIDTADGSQITASQMLERFLFPGSTQYTQIAKLSGGEKKRLYLLRVLMSAPNLLLLDEPTNDLDTETLTVLEDYLQNFSGTIIVVSHDRYFLDKVVNNILYFTNDGIITKYTGNYSDLKDHLAKTNLLDDKIFKEKNTYKSFKTQNTNKQKKLKFTFKEQKEYEEIDEKISQAELSIKEIDEKINISNSDYELLENLLSEKKDLENILDNLIERWTYLNELAEEIKKNNN